MIILMKPLLHRQDRASPEPSGYRYRHLYDTNPLVEKGERLAIVRGDKLRFPKIHFHIQNLIHVKETA